MDAECALTLPISHFKVVYYTSVGYRVSDDVSWSIIQNIYDYMDKNVEKLSSSQFIVAETIRLFTPHDISIRDSIVSMSIFRIS